MAELKKNAVNQILFTMVDKTDFNTVETSLASNFTVKRFAVSRGSAAAAVGTLSRIVSKVGSGVYRLSLEASACNCDFMFLRIAHASAATQMLAFEMKTLADDDISNYLSNMSNYLSAASDILSKVYVQTTVAASGASLIPGMSDILSKVYVQTTSMASVVTTKSDFGSQVAAAVWGARAYSGLNAASTVFGTSTFGSALLLGVASLTSNIASGVWAHAQGASVVARVSQVKAYAIGASNILSAVYVDTTDISDILSKVYAHTTGASDIISKVYVQTTVAASGASLIPGMSDILSKVYVQTTDNNSFLKSVVASRLSGISDILSAVYVDTADISNIASQIKVQTDKIAGMSDILSNVYVDTTDISNILSNVHADLADLSAIVSDFQSNLLSLLTVTGVSLTSDVMSNLRSAVAAGPAATITAGDISNIASAVWGESVSTLKGVAASFGSRFAKLTTSDALSKTQSDIKSMMVVYNSQMSALVSNVYSLVSDVQSAVAATATASDVASKVWVHAMAAGYSAAGTVLSNIISKIAAGPTTGLTVSNISDIASRVWSEKYNAHSAASSFGSAFEKMYSTLSNMSNILSAVYVDTTDISDILSKVYAHTTGASNILSAVYVDTADISNIVSNIKVQTDKIAGMSDILSAVYVDTAGISDKVSSIHSFVSTTMGGSDMYSMVGKLTSRITAAVATQSKLGVVQGVTSQIYLDTADISNIVSQVKVQALKLSGMSDILSKVYADTTDISDILSNVHADLANLSGVVSDFQSNLMSVVSATGVKVLSSNMSTLSAYIAAGPASADATSIASVVWAQSVSALKGAAGTFASRFAKLTTSDALSKAQSSIESHVSGVTATVSSDAMSTIASMVWAEAWDTHSNAGSFGSAFEVMMSNLDSAASAAVQANSRVLLVQSRVSDISSQVWAGDVSTLKATAATFGSRFAKLTTSDALSKTQSSIESHVSGITATVDNASIASAVWAHAKATSTLSYGAVAASGASLIPGMSDILSKVYVDTTDISNVLSGVSNILSAVYVDTASISDILSKVYVHTSDIQSKIAGASWMSDMASMAGVAVWNAKYTAHSAASTFGSLVSDIYSAAFAGALTSDAMSKVGVAVWTNTSGVKVRSRVSDLYSMCSDTLSIVSAGVPLSASALSDIGSVITAQLDTAFTDATSLNANGLKDRLRTMGWIIRNRLVVNDTTGAGFLYKDDGATEAFSVAAQFTDDTINTTRKRYE